MAEGGKHAEAEPAAPSRGGRTASAARAAQCRAR